jgi:hypothetical protein
VTNYISATHEYDDSNEYWNSESRDVWYAVKPTPNEYRMVRKDSDAVLATTEWENSNEPDWVIMGGKPVELYSKHDIAGLRKLLDELEKEMS